MLNDNIKIEFNDVVLSCEGEIYNIVERMKPKNDRKINKQPYVFGGLYDGDYRHIKDDNISYAYQKIKESVGFNKLTVESINEQVIRKFFECNYPIEEISYITGRSLSNIAKYIPQDEMLKYVKKKNHVSKSKSVKVYPFPEIIKVSI